MSLFTLNPGLFLLQVNNPTDYNNNEKHAQVQRKKKKIQYLNKFKQKPTNTFEYI